MITVNMRQIALAFAELETRGIIARANFMCCTGCGCAAMEDERAKWTGETPVIGGVFFHEQNVEGANEGGALWLNHGPFSDDAVEAQQIAQITIEVLREHGFTVDWDGDITRKIAVRPPAGNWVLSYPANRY